MSFRNGSNITYTHAFKMLKSWEELGLVKIERVGRECFPSLTEKGRRVFSLLLNLLREVKEVEVGKKKKSEGVEENTNF
jgi:DNA-binding MarR family transcriptional regulator